MNRTVSDAANAVAIESRPVHDEILEKLLEMIGDTELAPGARMPEERLRMRFGVSRAPLREALKVLASEGLLDLHPKPGRGGRDA
jgi:DNA-binding GntR family transcriptional regulator